MNIFYIGLDSEYVCDTPKLLRGLFRRASQKTFYYGPGYLSDEDLCLGIDYWLNLVRPDIIVTSDYAVGLSEVISGQSGPLLSRIYPTRRLLPSAVSNQAIQYLVDAIDRVLSARNAPLLITLLETDLYKLSLAQSLRLDKADYFLGFGSQFTPAYGELVENKNEIKRLRDTFTPYGFEFAIKNASRTITTLDFVPDILETPSALQSRRYRWSVPGVAYTTRKSAIASLKDANIHVRYGRSFIGRLFYHQAFPYFVRSAALSRYKAAFKAQIKYSKYSYTCGSSCMTPVTKFFEIPSMGSLLVGQPFYNSHDAGYRSGHNFLEADPFDLPGLDLWLKRNPSIAQKIASAGHELIATRHTLNIRTRQIAECLQFIKDSTFKGTFWENGMMFIN